MSKQPNARLGVGVSLAITSLPLLDPQNATAE
jgi:hypothetical protein